jgi:hypothetical protein
VVGQRLKSDLYSANLGKSGGGQGSGICVEENSPPGKKMPVGQIKDFFMTNKNKQLEIKMADNPWHRSCSLIEEMVWQGEFYEQASHSLNGPVDLYSPLIPNP